MKVDSNYQRSSERKVRLDDDFYSPMLSAKYENGQLMEMIVYKAEGLLIYMSDDFRSDSLLLPYFAVDSVRRVKLSDDFLLDNSNRLLIAKRIHGDTVYCIHGDFLYLYTFQ